VPEDCIPLQRLHTLCLKVPTGGSKADDPRAGWPGPKHGGRQTSKAPADLCLGGKPKPTWPSFPTWTLKDAASIHLTSQSTGCPSNYYLATVADLTGKEFAPSNLIANRSACRPIDLVTILMTQVATEEIGSSRNLSPGTLF